MAALKQITLPKLPKWLPPNVKEHALNLIKIGGLYTAQPLLLRLVSDPEMEAIWVQLHDKVVTKQKLVDFLEFVRLHPTLQGDPQEFIEIPSDKAQRSAFNKLARNSENSLKQLTALTKSKRKERAWELVEAALKRSELFEVGNASKDKFLHVHEIQTRLKSVQAHISIPLLIETIRDAAMLASEAPDDKYPVRRNSPQAKANKFILDLDSYFTHALYVQPTYVELAAIVNTTFQSPDGGISPDNVRKLLNPEKKEVNFSDEN